MKHAIIIAVAGGLVLLAVYMMFIGMTQQAVAPSPEVVSVDENDAVTATPLPSLTGSSWTWVETSTNRGDVITPRQPDAFTVTFSDDRVAITTDCNSGSSSYVINDTVFAIGMIAQTKMYCEDSQESDFFRMLQDVTSYHISDDGELILGLKFDSGSMRFR